MAEPAVPEVGFAHRPALDGLRGAAVIGVIAHHLNYLPGGYLGVDLFFVMSGYLITSLMIVEVSNTRRVNLAAFWGRRARRLLPAMVATVAAVSLYAWKFAEPAELNRIRREGLAALVYVSNWVQLGSKDNYWDQYAAPSPLRHMWSLAIEEQFYVFWPLVVMVIVRWVAHGSARRTARAIALLAAVGAAASMLTGLLLFDPTESTLRMYYGTDTRVGAILLGALVASVSMLQSLPPSTDEDQSRRRRLQPLSNNVVDGIGAALTLGLALAWWRLEGTSPVLWRGGLALCSVAAAGMVAILGSQREGIWNRVFAVRPLCWVGTISYGLYLWHWPIIVLLDEERTGLSGFPLAVIRIAVSVAAAVLSYRFIEAPIRRRRIRGVRLTVLASTATAVTIALLFLGTRTIVATTSSIDIDEELKAAEKTGPKPTESLLFPADTPIRVMVVGDSVGENLALAAERLAKRSTVMTAKNVSLPGCPLEQKPIRIKNQDGTMPTSNPACSTWADVWTTAIDEFQPNVALVTYGAAIEAKKEVVEPDGFFGPCETPFTRYWEDNLGRALDLLIKNQVRPIVTTVSYFRGFMADGKYDYMADCFNNSIRAVAKDRPEVIVVDLKDWVCPEAPTCRTEFEGRELRPDGLHFDTIPAEIVVTWVLRQALGPWPGP